MSRRPITHPVVLTYLFAVSLATAVVGRLT